IIILSSKINPLLYTGKKLKMTAEQTPPKTPAEIKKDQEILLDLALYRKTAESDMTHAYMLGQYYEKELRGLSKNIKEAAKYYRLAANQGHALALEDLEKLADPIDTVRDPDALYHLGYYYFNGFGVERNKKEAQRWLNKAVVNYYEKGRQNDYD